MKIGNDKYIKCRKCKIIRNAKTKKCPVCIYKRIKTKHPERLNKKINK